MYQGKVHKSTWSPTPAQQTSKVEPVPFNAQWYPPVPVMDLATIQRLSDKHPMTRAVAGKPPLSVQAKESETTLLQRQPEESASEKGNAKDVQANNATSPIQNAVRSLTQAIMAGADPRRVAEILNSLSAAEQRDVLNELMRTNANNPALGLAAEGLAAINAGSGPLPNAALSAATGGFPKGGWNPPGNQPIPFYIGDQAHRSITQVYRGAHAGGDVIFTNFTPISSILQRLRISSQRLSLSQSELDAKPDILNASKQHLYEIKPKGSEGLAATEAAAYIAILAKAGVTITPGSTSEPGTKGIIPAPGGYYIFESPVAGVIVYQYRKGDYVPVTVPAQASKKSQQEQNLVQKISAITGLTGTALLIYLVISEGSRLFPPRNLVPVP
ncbi:hypothetical protein [Anthocerotibacter panamensis]|uniref:hypothetical protein n=1 Tax=Anthocerotibacter panamensis TaxID=2857077 RepID=UPI001C4031E6|nr:hypothetical protein [Anthocerotibacter panamensis]